MIDEPDPYLTWDAAYVLGALSPTDRRTYEQHLSECEHCRDAVAELAGVPGMLALVPRDMALSMVGEQSGATVQQLPPPPPERILHRLIAETERKRRRSRLIAVGAAVAAAAAAVAVALPVAGIGGDDSTGHSTAQVTAERSMTNLIATPLSAHFKILSNPDGTSRIDLECRYATDSTRSYSGEYAMFVTSTDGAQSHLATWKAEPGDVVTPSATTNIPADKIASVDIRSAETDQVILIGNV